MDIWIAVWLTQFIMVFIINAFTLVVFARSRHLRRRNTYLIMNLTVADLLIAAVSGPENILLQKANKRPKKGFGVLHVYLIISDMCWIASLGNLVLISLERLHATLYPFRHCLLGKSFYYKIITFTWFGALTLACGVQISRMNDVPLADGYPWIIYICLTFALLTTSYVIIMSKAHVQQLGSVMSAERKLSVTLFIVSAASILTLLPWVIIICISISSDRYLWLQFTPMKIASTFYHLNSILNPVIYAIRLPEFRRASKELFCKSNSYPVRQDQPIGL